MSLRQKLIALRQNLDNEVLYRFTVGKGRLLNKYVKLSDLRLASLSCDAGRIVFSTAAPTLEVRGHVPRVVFRDNGVYTIIDGNRQGMNVTLAGMHSDENVIETRTCGFADVTYDNCPKWLEHRVMTMGKCPWPIATVVLPELFRITRHPEAIKPIINSTLLTALGMNSSDTSADINTAFQENISTFGTFTDEGIILPFSIVASGGMVIASTAGMTVGGGVVRCIPLRSFRADASRNRWSIHTAADKEV